MIEKPNCEDVVHHSEPALDSKGPHTKRFLAFWSGVEMSPFSLRYSKRDNEIIYDEKKASKTRDKMMLWTTDDPILIKLRRPPAMTTIQVLLKGTAVRRFTCVSNELGLKIQGSMYNYKLIPD
jgi:hypothetical protein